MTKYRCKLCETEVASLERPNRCLTKNCEGTDFWEQSFSSGSHKLSIAVQLEKLGFDLANYKAPESEKTDFKADILRFNNNFSKLASKKVYEKAFTVRIVVGDLQGFGDVTAGAKLAKQLCILYAANTDIFGDTVVELDLRKGGAEGIAAEKIAEGIIGNSDVLLLKNSPALADIMVSANSSASTPIDISGRHGLGNSTSAITLTACPFDLRSLGTNVEETSEPSPTPKHKRDDRKLVTISYPAHNAPGDFKIQQYGFIRWGQDGAFGSGPGWGSIGVLPLDREAEKIPVSSKVAELFSFLEKRKIKHFHFAYFSKYEAAIKFVKKTLEIKGYDKENIAFIFARSATKMESVKSSLEAYESNPGWDIKCANENDFSAKFEKKKQRVLLFNFKGKIANADMLKLYLKSTAPVGATGDQSFMEAYAMRRDAAASSSSAAAAHTPVDIFYDLRVHQCPLIMHLSELIDGNYRKSLPPEGLIPIKVNNKINEAIDKKSLVHSAAMIINDLLQSDPPNKKDFEVESDSEV